MKDDKQRFAVLTGDLVNSSSLSPIILKKTMSNLQEAANTFADVFPGSVFGKLDIYSGDGWQLLMPDWPLSLRAAVFFRAVVKTAKEIAEYVLIGTFFSFSLAISLAKATQWAIKQ